MSIPSLVSPIVCLSPLFFHLSGPLPFTLPSPRSLPPPTLHPFLSFILSFFPPLPLLQCRVCHQSYYLIVPSWYTVKTVVVFQRRKKLIKVGEDIHRYIKIFFKNNQKVCLGITIKWSRQWFLVMLHKQQELQFRFSFKCRKVITLPLLRYMIGLENLRYFFIQSEVKPESVATPANTFSRAFQQLHVIRILIGSLDCLSCNWLEWIPWVWSCDTRSKTALNLYYTNVEYVLNWPG